MKKSSKEFLLVHSESKLKLYSGYLKLYLKILAYSPYINKINIFDIYCGKGIYDNEKKGSPILAFDIIRDLYYEFKSQNKNLKLINLIINDIDSENVKLVKEYINQNNMPEVCKILYFEEDANVIQDALINTIRKQQHQDRNLIFIDPYGYKKIHKTDIEKLIELNNTEVILFLPVYFIYRFLTLSKAHPAYDTIQNFIQEFSIDVNKCKDVFKFIHLLKEELNFKNKYYSTSFYIQRDKTNVYSIFFITHNIYGLEKFIDIKWDLDRSYGEGYRKDSNLELFTTEGYKRLEKPIKQ